MKKIRIFISSPTEVIQERLCLYSVIRQLNYEFASHFILEPIMWENLPLDAGSSFQDGIDCFTEMEGIDITIFILGSKLGSPLDKKMRDGTLYDSGTVYEFEMVLKAREQSNQEKPLILVYRSKRSFVEYVSNKELFKDGTYLNQCIEEQKRVNAFFDSYFNKEGKFNSRAYHEFESVTVFSQKVKEHLRVLLRNMLPVEKECITTFHGCPYKGLQSFEYEDEPIFFGREKAVNEIIEKLKSQAEEHKPFVLIIGQSGSGKSSLIKAGVLPRIVLSGNIENVDWRLASLSPGQYAGNLCETFIESLTQTHAFPELLEMESINDRIRSKFQEDAQIVCWQIEDLINTISQSKVKTKDVRLLLFIDQFEEIFTHQNIPISHKQKFFELLNRLADSKKVWIIATIRSDYYASFQDNRLLKLRGKYGLYDLLNPNSSELREIIIEPAIRAGLKYEKDTVGGISLDEVILNDVKENANVLPLLEFALTELYVRRNENNVLTFEAYRNLGGIKGALATRAEACYNEMNENLKKIFPSVISSLLGVNKETKKPFRKHTNFDEAIKSEEHRQIIEHFTNARLFVVDKDDKNQPYVAFVHEAIIENWQRISEWFAHNLNYLEKEAYIKEQNYHWKNNGKEKAFLMTKIQQLNNAEVLEKEWVEHLEDEDKYFISESRRLILRRNIEYWIMFIIISIGMVLYSDDINNGLNLPLSFAESIKLIGVGILIPSIWETFLRVFALPRFKTLKAEFWFWATLCVSVLLFLFSIQVKSDNYFNYFFVIPFVFVFALKAYGKWIEEKVSLIKSSNLRKILFWSNNNMGRQFFILTIFLVLFFAFVAGGFTRKVKSENVKSLLSGNVETFVRLLDTKSEIIEMTLKNQTDGIVRLLNSKPKQASNENGTYSFFYSPEILRNKAEIIFTDEIRKELFSINQLNVGNKFYGSKDYFRLDNLDTCLIPVSFDQAMIKTPDYSYNSANYPEILHLTGFVDVFNEVRNIGHNSDMILWQYVGFENGLFSVFPWNIFEDLNYDPTKRVWFNTPVDSIVWYFYKFSSTNQMGFTCAKGFKYSNNKKAVSAVDASLHKIISGFMPSFVLVNNISTFLLDMESNETPIIWSNQDSKQIKNSEVNQILDIAKNTYKFENKHNFNAHNIEIKLSGSTYFGSYVYCNRLKLLCVFMYEEN